MKIRVGLEGNRKPVIARAREIGAPILISANSLWDNERQKWYGWRCYAGLDVALDCGGFVAMKRYGGYRWTVDQYVKLAAEMRPEWYAQMDFCCEPEIAADQSVVFKRIDSTVAHLHACQDAARTAGAAMPMPVLQGWNPSDYCQGPIYDQGFQWPALVGIGSVCRRQVNGPDGVVAVVSALDAKVPDHVRFHLFGVKTTALKELATRFPNRIESSDSMSWNMARRWDQRRGLCDGSGATRAEYMARWYTAQRAMMDGGQD